MTYSIIKRNATNLLNQLMFPKIDTQIVKNTNYDDIDSFLGKYDNKDYFILKEIYSLDSHNLFVKNKFETLEMYNSGSLEDYIIQPYLEGFSLFNCNLLAVKGELVEFMVITQANNYEKDNVFGRNMFENRRFILDEKHPYFNRIVEYSKKIVSKSSYSGFADIEFLCRGDQILLLK